MSTAVSEPTSGVWEELPTSQIVFLFNRRSHAERRIDEIARRLEAAYRRGWSWLLDSSEPRAIDVHLADWFAEADRPGWIGSDRRAIQLPIRPEQSDRGLERTVLRLLASRPPVSSSDEPTRSLTAWSVGRP